MTPDLKWLTDPTVFAVNRLDAHSDHVCYRSEAEIRLGGSSLRQSLDGRWRFAYSACPAARPAGSVQPRAASTRHSSTPHPAPASEVSAAGSPFFSCHAG